MSSVITSVAPDPHRLPQHVRPKHYELRLRPDLEKFTFSGTVTIDVTVDTTTPAIVLNAKELEVQSAELNGEGDVRVEMDTEHMRVALVPETAVAPGEHKLTLTFTGTLNDKLAGFYRSKYTRDGVDKYLATTQFEAADARRALPCFDEPNMKATFKVFMETPAGLTALGNMPVVNRSELEGGWSLVEFDTTPIMSTYLLAFIVGELERVHANTNGGVEVSVYTLPGRTASGEFALNMGVKTLDYFTEFFGIEYPLPKCDMVAIPDFSMGAMENWGLVTYRETALLADKTSSASGRQRVAYVVGHELAHQWFGNLVTMKWWNDLWLNEGFATWAGWLAVDHVYPDWNVWQQFTAQDATYALNTDALKSSHPIEVPISSVEEVEQVFDALSYQKGACVIRMLEAFLGPEPFRRGLNIYLNRFKYSNAATADLWAALSEASGRDVAAVMGAWTKEMGYPAVSLEEAGEGDFEGTAKLTVTQRRFLAGGAASEEDDKVMWQVPVTLAYADAASGVINEEMPLLLTDKSQTLSLVYPRAEGAWAKLNYKQSGFYRVNYTPLMWERITEAARSGALPALDRLGVVSDAAALVKAGMLPPHQLLELWNAVAEREEDYSVWSQVLSDVDALEDVLAEQDFFPLYRAFVRRLTTGIASKLGWEVEEGESHLLGMLRPMVLAAQAGCDDPDTVEQCKRRFHAYLGDSSTLHPNLRGLVMSTAVKHGGVEEFERCVQHYKDADQPELKLRALVAAGQSRDKELQERFLDWMLTSGDVRGQDIFYALMAMNSNVAGRRLCWEFTKRRWADLYGKFKGAGSMVSYIATIPIRRFADDAVADDVVKFFEETPVPEASMGLARGIEGIRTRASWLSRDKDAIRAWLEANVSA